MSITAGHLPTWRQPVGPGGIRLRPSRFSSTHVQWGRIVALLAIVAVSALLGAGLRAATAAEPVRSDDGASVAAADPALVQHVVQPGDTIWAIASAVDPTADPRAMVDRILRLNGLTSANVEVGRVLLVPAAA